MHVTCTEGVAAAATRELFRVEKDAKRRSTATTLDLSESEYSEITAMDHSDNSGSEEGESIDELIAQITREVSETFMKECQDASKSPSEINVEDVAQLVAASLLKRQQEKAKRKPGKTYATIEEYDRDFWDGELRELEGKVAFSRCPIAIARARVARRRRNLTMPAASFPMFPVSVASPTHWLPPDLHLKSQKDRCHRVKRPRSRSSVPR